MKLMIEGMMCVRCVARAKKALEAAAGCPVEVSLEEKCAVVGETAATAEALCKAVTDAGYKVVEVID